MVLSSGAFPCMRLRGSRSCPGGEEGDGFLGEIWYNDCTKCNPKRLHRFVLLRTDERVFTEEERDGQCKGAQIKEQIQLFEAVYYKKVITIIAAVFIIAAVVLGVSRHFMTDSKTTKIGFEDIGELATQSAYCTEVNVTEAARELFGITIPFTESKYIYSYDIVIKAGFDFEEIEWKENGNTIEVSLPETKILSSEIDLDSFKIYHEDESIFREITMSENNEALKSMKENAEKDAVANGLLENARSNAETILNGFFGNVYDLDEYEIVYKDK